MLLKSYCGFAHYFTKKKKTHSQINTYKLNSRCKNKNYDMVPHSIFEGGDILSTSPCIFFTAKYPRVHYPCIFELKFK